MLFCYSYCSLQQKSRAPSISTSIGLFVEAALLPHFLNMTTLYTTAFSHAVLQTFILLSSAKCTTIANLHTLR